MIYALPPEFDVWIEAEEGDLVRMALRRAGEVHAAERFTSPDLHRLLAGWQTFVETDWTEFDEAEYAHDLVVRRHLEIILDAVGSASRERLGQALEPLDRKFKERMHPRPGAPVDEPFWAAKTIWNTPYDETR
jgi:hypothetical protein